ncbi:serine hydrolase domain-containing protein [Cryptosporangium minutisporangium]|uniref:Serine hydrolase domain-containing protein n=1 Tax=Cryptosporangium minutisporangium TaxID=113569 RepID=A0ABP6SZB8_9ACTN
MAPTDQATAACERIIRTLQADERVPAVAAAVFRADRPDWSFYIGDAGDGAEVRPETQFRIGSVTKTLTAVLVLQLRDSGMLDLDDPIDAHLAVPAHGQLTIRSILNHTSGLQREPWGNVWDTLDVPDDARMLEEVAKAEAVLSPRRRWHYSNLGFALLGQLVAAKTGATWEEALADRLLNPLGLTDTTLLPREPAAQGYLVDEYSDHARPEPHFDLKGAAAAAQLWSTAGDMARWALFLAKPDPAVLARSTLEEMYEPVVVTDPVDWHTGWGLGLQTKPQGSGSDRALDVGHNGAMPGFLAGVWCRRGVTIGAAVLGSSGTAGGITAAPHRLIAASLEHDPVDIQPWTIGEPVPREYVDILGRWWSEGSEFVFRWHRGHLEGRSVSAVAAAPPAIFAFEAPDLLRTVSGREAGERLELFRGPDGKVELMRWATYRFTRTQQTYDEWAH